MSILNVKFGKRNKGNKGDLYTFGNNYYGQLGFRIDYLDRKRYINVPRMIKIGENKNDKSINSLKNKIKYVACGENHTAFIDIKGNLYTFGHNNYDKLGRENVYPLNIGRITEIEVDGVLYPMKNKIKYVACGDDHTAFIDDKGKLYTFGKNVSGQLGTGDQINRKRPTLISLYQGNQIVKKKAKYVSCGRNHTVVVDTEGNLYTFGDNMHGELGRPDEYGKYDNLLPMMIKLTQEGKFVENKVKYISSGIYHNAIIDTQGKLYTFGSNYGGQLGTGNYEDSYIPRLILTKNKVKMVSCQITFTSFIDIKGNLYSFGKNEFISGLFYDDYQSAFQSPLAQTFIKNKLKYVSCGKHYMATIDFKKNLYIFGGGYTTVNDGKVIPKLIDIAKDDEINVKIKNKVKFISCGENFVAFIA